MNADRLLLYLTVFAIMGLSDAVIPVLPELAAADHVTYGAAASSLLFSAYFLGALITMLPFGIMADRCGNIRFVTLGVVLTLFSGLVILIFENLWILSLARFVEGAACGAFFPAAYSILSEFKNKKRFMGEFNFLINAGLATGVVLSGFLAEISIKGGILAFTVFSAGVMAVAMFVLARSKTPTIRLNNDLKKEITNEIGKTIKTLFDTRFIRTWILSFVLFGATAVLIAFYPDYSKEFLTKSELGAAIAAVYVSAMITSLLVGRTLMNYRTMIRIGMAITAIGAVIAIKHPMIGFSILGGGSGIGMVGLPIAVSHMKTDRGLAMGLFNTCTYGGLALMPIFAGFFTGYLNFEWIFMLSAVLLGVSVFLEK